MRIFSAGWAKDKNTEEKVIAKRSRSPDKLEKELAFSSGAGGDYAGCEWEVAGGGDYTAGETS